jgi:hypothetical protein
VRLLNPQLEEAPGVQTDNGTDTLFWELVSPVPADGSADGTYTIQVKAVDKTGGTTEESITFLYDTQVPDITGITPPDGGILTESPTRVVVQVSDGAGSGVDFAASRVSMELTLDGAPVPNILRSDNGVDTMTFIFPELEETGRYVIQLTLTDKAGNSYTYQSRFDLVEKASDVLPEVVSTEPQERSYVNALDSVTVLLQDNSGRGIDLDASSVRLLNPQLEEAPGVQTDNGTDTLFWELVSPVPADGSADGTYTIQVKAVDKTGGTTEESFDFYYDTVSPSVVATTPAANDVFYEGITQVLVQLNDSGSGVDLEGTEVTLQGPMGQVETDKNDNGVDTITLSFSKLTESGNYIIHIVSRDRAGNTGFPVEVKFSYVLKAPAVRSVTLTNRAYVKNLESIEAAFDDRSGVGLDLSETGSSIVVTGPSGEIQADQTSVGDDTIVWRPVHPLATDGTDDGVYTVTVTPVDTTGASGQSRQYTLIYDTQPPEVTSASPVDINADVTHVGQQLTVVQASLTDEGPAEINIDDQIIYLETQDGTQIPGIRTDNDSDTVSWRLTRSLAKDGTADGIYSVVVNAVDQAGNDKEFRYSLIYDTVPPEVTEVSPSDDSKVIENITQVSVKLEDAGDGEIDFLQSEIELRTPSGGSISGMLSNDGLETMTLDFSGLEENGTYEVFVTAVDKAGNGADTSWSTRFVYETALPVVISTTPVTRPPDRAYANSSINDVRVVLRETDGAGIDLSPTGSEIKLRGPDGNLVVGSQRNQGLNTLIFTLGKSLAMDGSDDGQYTILVKTANAAKRKDDEYREYSFIYDTQHPEVASASYLNVDANISYVSEQITELEVRLEDEGPAGVDMDRSTIRLIDPNRSTVDGKSSHNDLDTLKLKFPAGLSLEGDYSLEVVAVDKAGNATSASIEFIYSTNLPEVVSTTPVTVPAEEAYVNSQIKDVRAELRQTGNSGIDFSPTGSTIRLRNPKGNYLSGVQSRDGDTLIFTLTNPLPNDGSADGFYNIVVVPVNAAKLSGQELEFSFFYDTVPPEADEDDITLGLAGEAGSSLNDISAIVNDPSKNDQPGSGIDIENFDNSWLKLRDSSGADIPGEVSVRTLETGHTEIVLLLDVPLASNGSGDGFYTVTVAPSDRAGNIADPVVQYEFLYDTRPPTVNKAEITINEKTLLLDSSLEEYPTAVNTKNSVTIVARLEDNGIGTDLTRSSINIINPAGNPITGSLMQDGVNTIWLTTGILYSEGRYSVEINPVDLHDNGLSRSSETIFTEFLFETKKPQAQLTEPADEEVESEDEPVRLEGTATDESAGSEENRVEASGVAKVEIGGKGPGDVQLDWIQAVDDSDADEEPWSKWYLDFLPDISGTYDIDIRVWDKAGNYEVYDAGLELEFTVSLAFQGDAYCWPNPVTNGVAHISFEINVPESQNVTVILFVYDVSGDLIYEQEHKGIPSRTRTSLEWNCTNGSGEKVVTGIYAFRLEAELTDGEVANKVGKPMIIKN